MPPDQIYCSRQCSSASRKEPRETRVCETCGKEFEFRRRPSSRANAGKYCSIDCRIIGTRTGYHPCPICGKAVDSQRVYCSPECFQEFQQEHGASKRNGRVVECEWCSASFYLSKYRLEQAQHYFCCPEHQIAWQGRNKIEYNCKTCGKAFLWSPSREKNNTPTYCSLKCRNADPELRKQWLVALNQLQKRQRTTPERIGYKLLDAMNIDYTAQYLFKNKFTVDAFVPAHRLVIQIDGDYWHGHPDRFPNPDERQQRRMNYDRSQDAYMKACGFHVVRVWETDLKHALPEVRLALQNVLEGIEQNPSDLLSYRLQV